MGQMRLKPRSHRAAVKPHPIIQQFSALLPERIYQRLRTQSDCKRACSSRRAAGTRFPHALMPK